MPDARLRVTAPRVGLSWAIGSLHWLAWEGSIEDGTIEWSADGGVTWAYATVEPYSPYDPNTAYRFRWRVPETTAKTVKLRAIVKDRVSSAVDVTILPSQRARYQWTRKTAAGGFVWRDGAALERAFGKLQLLGGWNPTMFRVGDDDFNKTTSEIWSSEDGARWSLASVAPWEPRHTFGHAQLGSRLYVLGGDALQGHYQPDVWSTADGTSWTRETAEAPWGHRVLHRALAHDGALWVLGGQTMPDMVDDREPLVFFDDVWRSVDGRAWTRVLEHAPWPPRGATDGSASFRGAMWIVGGGTYEAVRKAYADVWSSRDGVAWTKHEDPPWPARQYNSVAVYDDKLWMLAGYTPIDGLDQADVWYTADGENWYEQANDVWSARHAAATVATREGLWLTAGSSGDTSVTLLERAR